MKQTKISIFATAEISRRRFKREIDFPDRKLSQGRVTCISVMKTAQLHLMERCDQTSGVRGKFNWSEIHSNQNESFLLHRDYGFSITLLSGIKMFAKGIDSQQAMQTIDGKCKYRSISGSIYLNRTLIKRVSNFLKKLFSFYPSATFIADNEAKFEENTEVN